MSEWSLFKPLFPGSLSLNIRFFCKTCRLSVLHVGDVVDESGNQCFKWEIPVHRNQIQSLKLRAKCGKEEIDIHHFPPALLSHNHNHHRNHNQPFTIITISPLFFFPARIWDVTTMNSRMQEKTKIMHTYMNTLRIRYQTLQSYQL